MMCWASTSSFSTMGYSVSWALALRLECRLLQNLETVRRHQQRLGGKIELVVGSPDALEKPARSLGRADMDDQGGIVLPFIGIKVIDLLLTLMGWV